MNILLVVSDLALGGAQQIVINLANELVRQNHKVWIFDVQPEYRVKGMISKLDERVHLISKDYNEHQISLTEKVIDFALNKLSINNNLKNQRFNNHIKNLNRVLSLNSIDYLNSHTCWADFYVFKNLKKFHDIWIISLHASYNGLLSIQENIIKFGNLTKQTLLSAHKIIYIHDVGISFLEKRLNISILKKKKIYNGINQKKFKTTINRVDLNIEKNDFVILCASRASKLKGWYELANAITMLKNPNIILIFAGDGEILPKVKEKYSKYKSQIKFLGFQKNIENLISISNIVCLPSYTEALPTILLESIFINKPVLATNVGETSKILNNVNGECGILLNQKNGKKLTQELYEKINFLFNNKPSFDKEAFKLARDIFSIEKMAKNYLNYFSEC